MIYGDKVRQYRERNNIKQKDILNKLYISKSLYSEYEQEIKNIPVKHLNTICNLFNTSFDYIFGFTEIKQYRKSKNLNELDKQNIGERLKQFRKENKMSRKLYEREIGCPSTTIADYENGKYLISVTVLYRICKKFNISADYLLGKIDSKKKLS